MSCIEKWTEYNKLLQATTNLPAGTADAALRCVKCGRPLLKSGQCVLGHAQLAADAPSPYPPALDAARCALEELLAEVSAQTIDARPLPRDVQTAQLLLQLLPHMQWAQATPAGGDTLLYVAPLLLSLSASSARRDTFWRQDPRLQVALAGATGLLLDRAEAQLRENNPDLAAAWLDFATAQEWAERTADSAAQARAQAGLYAIIPAALDDGRPVPLSSAARLPLAAPLLEEISAATGLAFRQATYFHAPSPGKVARDGGIFIAPADPGFPIPGPSSLERQGDVRCFNVPARQALQVLGLTTFGRLPGNSYEEVCLVPIATISRLLRQRLDRAAPDLHALRTYQDKLRQAAGRPAVEVAQQIALPLWQEGLRVEREHAARLSALAAPGQELVAHIRAAKAEAMAALRAVPPRLLPQAMTGLGYERRAMDLLKYKAVRDVVFAPDSRIDTLTLWPLLAPRAVAGLKFCEAVEALRTTPAQTGFPTWPAGPRNHPELLELLRIRSLLAGVYVPAQTADRSATHEVLGQITDALSAHVPPARAPFHASSSGYYSSGRHDFGENTRLSQAVHLFNAIWGAGLDRTDLYSSDDVRTWAEAAGMPGGRYADRGQIIAWLQAAAPEAQATQVRQIYHDLQGKQSRALRAIDQTGTDRTYKVGERIRADVEGAAQEGNVTNCVLAGVNVDAAGYCDALEPSVEVLLADGSTRVLPITQVEFVPRKR